MLDFNALCDSWFRGVSDVTAKDKTEMSFPRELLARVLLEVMRAKNARHANIATD